MYRSLAKTEKFLLGLCLCGCISLALAQDESQDDPCNDYTDANQKTACENFIKQYRVPPPPSPPEAAASQTTETKPNPGFRMEQPKFPTMPGIIPPPTEGISNPLLQPQPPAQHTITPLFNINVPPTTTNKPIQAPAAKTTPAPVVKQPTETTTSSSTIETTKTIQPTAPQKPPSQFFDQGQENGQARRSIYQ